MAIPAARCKHGRDVSTVPTVQPADALSRTLKRGAGPISAPMLSLRRVTGSPRLTARDERPSSTNATARHVGAGAGSTLRIWKARIQSPIPASRRLPRSWATTIPFTAS